MTFPKRPLLALGAAALMTVSLTACGGSDASGAPTNASKSDFCGAWSAIAAVSASGSDQAAFTSLQNAVKHLKDIGTPSDIPADARTGFEVMVDAVTKAKWDDVKNATSSSSFPGVSEADKAKAVTFGQYVAKECAS